MTSVGDLAARMAMREFSYRSDEGTPDEVAAVAATESLDHLAPLVRSRLLEAEAAEPMPADELHAHYRAESLNDYQGLEAAAHVAYLRIVAAVTEIMRSTRCVCHRRTHHRRTPCLAAIAARSPSRAPRPSCRATASPSGGGALAARSRRQDTQAPRRERDSPLWTMKVACLEPRTPTPARRGSGGSSSRSTRASDPPLPPSSPDLPKPIAATPKTPSDPTRPRTLARFLRPVPSYDGRGRGEPQLADVS